MQKTKDIIKIKVIAIGNRGCGVLNRLGNLTENNIELGAISFPSKMFNLLKIENKIELPHSIDLENGNNIEKATKNVIDEKKEEILKLVRGTDIVFLITNLTNNIPVAQTKEIAGLLKAEGSLVFLIGSNAFQFEGLAKQKEVEEARRVLSKEVDNLLIVDNEKISKEKISAIEAFTQIDKTIADLITAILDIIIKEGTINTDFADLRAIVKNSGEGFFNVSSGSKKEISVIVDNLFSKTNLTNQQKSFKKILYVVYSDESLTTDEMKQIGEKIHKKSGGVEKIIFGLVNNVEVKDEVKIVMIGS